MTDRDRFVVLTGGPGSGKTTLLTALAKRGLSVMPEAGRAVIREETAKGGTALPWADRARFAERMLDHDLSSYTQARALSGIVLFDRGIPDIVGYLDLCGLPRPERLVQAMAAHRYRCEVFIAPPWREIFANDAERKQDFDEACRTHLAMQQIYTEAGYSLIMLPFADVQDRVEFVLSRLARANTT